MEPIRRYRVNGRAFGVFVCRCGKEFGARLCHVRSGATSSCGCLRRRTLVAELDRIERRASPGTTGGGR